MGLEAGMDCRLVLVRCLIILGRYETALEVVTPALEARPFDQQAIAYQGLAWRLLGDPRADRLNDYDRFISSRILRSEEHTSELQSLMRISYAVFCLKKKKQVKEKRKT